MRAYGVSFIHSGPVDKHIPEMIIKQFAKNDILPAIKPKTRSIFFVPQFVEKIGKWKEIFL